MLTGLALQNNTIETAFLCSFVRLLDSTSSTSAPCRVICSERLDSLQDFLGYGVHFTQFEGNSKLIFGFCAQFITQNVQRSIKMHIGLFYSLITADQGRNDTFSKTQT